MPRSKKHRREHKALISCKGRGPKTGPPQKSCNIVYAAWLSRDSSFCYARGAGLVSTSAGFRYGRFCYSPKRFPFLRAPIGRSGYVPIDLELRVRKL